MSAPGDKARLGDVAQFVRGITFKPEDIVAAEMPGAVRCMRTKNVQSEIDLRDVWSVGSKFVKRREQYLTPGDLLVSSANSWNLVGKCCWVPELEWPSTFGGFISVLRADRIKLNPRYLYHWFAWNHTQESVRSFGRQTTNISNLDFSRCLNMAIPLPSMGRQQQIAEILDRTLALRDPRRRTIALLDDLMASIFHEMFELSSWPLIELGELISETKLGLVRSSAEFGSSGFSTPYIRMNAITSSGEYSTVGLMNTNANDREISEFGLKQDDLLFNTRNSRELVGKTTRIRNDLQAVFNNNLMRIRLNSRASATYISQFFRSYQGRRELNRRKSGTTSVFAIYFKDLRTIPIPLPPLADQLAFARLDEQIWSEKTRFRIQCTEIDSLLESLQHRAFNDQVL